MSEKCYVARASKIAARMLGDEMMVMVAPDSTLFSLNEIASLIFNAADGATPLDQIVQQRICSEFDVEPDVALRDAQELVNELAAHGVLVTSQEPIPAPLAIAQAAR